MMTLNPSNEIEAKTREVERYLYRLGDNIEKYARGHDEVLEQTNFQLDIYEAGAWIIKFRSPHRVLINNTETIITDGLKVDATIGFASSGSFWATVNGNLSLDSAAANFSGSEDALRYYKRKIFSSVERASDYAGDQSTKSLTRAYISNTRAEDEAMTTRPLKSGWMLKKKEIMRGWNSRYFRVYVGRFEYFMDPNDESPRAVIPLLDAKVSAFPKEIKVRGYDMHYQIMIEPKYHEKSFRLASERGGSPGKVEIESWQAAFNIASKPADIAATLIKAARERKILQDESDGVADQTGAGAIMSSTGSHDATRGEGGEGTNASSFPIVSAVRRLSAINEGGRGSIMPVSIPVAGMVAFLLVLLVAVYLGHIEFEARSAGSIWLALIAAAVVAAIWGSRMASGSLEEPPVIKQSRAGRSSRSPRLGGSGGGQMSRKQRKGSETHTPKKSPLSKHLAESPGSGGGDRDNKWETTPTKSKNGAAPGARTSPSSPASPDGVWRDVN